MANKQCSVAELISQLKVVDDPKRFKKEHGKGWAEREKYAKAVMAALAEAGSDAVGPLIEILSDPDTWSCIFAAKILGEIGDCRAIEPLVLAFRIPSADFLHESASSALRKIGKPAVRPLIEELEKIFSGALPPVEGEEVSWIFPLGTLAEIGTKEAVDYVMSVRGSMSSGDMAFYCGALGETRSKKVLPLLREIKEQYRRDRHVQVEADESIEIITRGTIDYFEGSEGLGKELAGLTGTDILERGIGYEEKGEFGKANLCYSRLIMEDFKSYHAEFCIARLDRKQGRPNLSMINQAIFLAESEGAGPEVLELMYMEKGETVRMLKERGQYDEGDEHLWLEFSCNACGRAQYLRTGQVIIVEGKPEDTLWYEFEIMCKHCHSHDLSLSKTGEGELAGAMMRSAEGRSDEVLSQDSKVYFRGKLMQLQKARKLVLSGLEKKPDDAEFLLRAANYFRRMNDHNKAIECYTRSAELNPRLIANHFNLSDIYAHRYKDFGIAEAKRKAESALVEAESLLASRKFYSATIRKPRGIVAQLQRIKTLLEK